MEKFIILRKHMLVKGYMVIKEDVSKQQLIEFIQKINESDLPQYKFIKGNFVKPTITYKVEQFKEKIVVDDVEVESGKETLAQKIYRKYSQGSVFGEQDNKGAV